MNDFNKNDLTRVINKVINDDVNFTQYKLEKDYGIRHSAMYKVRNQKKPIKNLTFGTILKMIDAYNDSQKNP